jgi:Domain of unknown function (DUF4282)
MARKCPSCGYPEPDNQALYCNKCGYPFPQTPPQNPAAPAPGTRPAPAAVRQRRRQKPGLAGFLSFDTLITENSLKLIYILGAVGIVLVSLMGVAGMFAKPIKGGANVSITNTTALAENPTGSPLFWIGFLIAGSVLWRMFCELFVVLSRVHGAPGYRGEPEPEHETMEYEETEGAGYGPKWSAQMVECPKCRKIVPVEELRECENCGIQGCTSCIRMMGLLKKTMTCRECFEAK